MRAAGHTARSTPALAPEIDPGSAFEGVCSTGALGSPLLRTVSREATARREHSRAHAGTLANTDRENPAEWGARRKSRAAMPLEAKPRGGKLNCEPTDRFFMFTASVIFCQKMLTSMKVLKSFTIFQFVHQYVSCGVFVSRAACDTALDHPVRA